MSSYEVLSESISFPRVKKHLIDFEISEIGLILNEIFAMTFWATWGYQMDL